MKVIFNNTSANYY